MAAKNDAQDIRAHASTYSGFLGLMKYGAMATAVVVAIVIFLISRH